MAAVARPAIAIGVNGCAQRVSARSSAALAGAPLLPLRAFTPAHRLTGVSRGTPAPARALLGRIMGAFESTAGLSPLWSALKKADPAGVQAAIASGADLNERVEGLTPLHFIARKGHYAYPPKEIPAALVKAGADIEAKDSEGLSALEVSLLKGWQNIAYLLLESKAQTGGVAAIKGRVTCPDCKRAIMEYKL